MSTTDFPTKGLKRIVEKIIQDKGRITHASGGSVVVEYSREEPIRYFFLGKTTTRYTGEYYLVVILVHESNQELGDLGRVEFRIRNGFLRLGRKITINGEGLLYELAKELKNRKALDHLYGSGYEYIIVEKGYKGREVKTSSNSIVLIGRSTLIYTLRLGRRIEKLYSSGYRLLIDIIREVYPRLNL